MKQETQQERTVRFEDLRKVTEVAGNKRHNNKLPNYIQNEMGAIELLDGQGTTQSDVEKQ